MKKINSFPRNLYELTNQSLMVRRRFITKYTSLSGVIISSKVGTNIWFESGLEKDFALTLEYQPSVKSFTEQPVTIEYFENNRRKIYTPDFLVIFNDKTQAPWLCEIKLRKDLRKNFSEYKAKFKAAVEFAKIQGWEFKLITESHFRTVLLENLKFLNQYEFKFVDPHCQQLIINRVEDLGSTTIKEVITSVSDANPNIQGKCIYALWYLLKSSLIGCDYSQPLSIESEIWKQ